MKRFFTSPYFLILAGVVLVLAYANHAFFFVTPWHEGNDFAVNALQIERAKHLDELYGNYSRYHFFHPGPAFFYLYALGEAVFYDWFSFVPSPHSAHSLAGLIVQAAFFAGALVIFARWVRSRWFLPLALLLGAVHFAFARDTFTSIWAPHVLVMPFICFLVACASTAAGRAAHLPVAALAGCFLVHGHVAQPLYVVTLFPLAYFLFWRHAHSPGERWSGFIRRFRWPHLLAAACIALFITPIVFDLFYGADSNFAHILEYLRSHGDEHKSLWRALLYLVAFFCYLHKQDEFLQSPVDTRFVTEGWPYFLVWAVVFAVIVAYALRLRRTSQATERPFIGALLLILAVTLGLSLYWGTIQSGPMYEFNGQFYYGILYAFVLLAAAALSRALPARGALVGGGALCLAAAVVASCTQQPPLSTYTSNYGIVAATAAALKADPHPDATKLLVFDHADWGEVASTALALKRAGKSYRVDGNWAFMFQRYRAFRPQPPDFSLDGMSIWRFSRQERPGPSVAITSQLRVYFEPAPLNPASTTIDCSKDGNINLYTIFGFTNPDGPTTWTNMPEAGLRFSSPPAGHDVVLTMTATPFAPHDRGIFNQPMNLFVNGHKVGSFDLRERATVAARIPRAVWNLRATVDVVFQIPGARSPSQLGMFGDPRILGWSFEKMTFSYAP